jgi:hypothetical protein
VSFEVPDEVDSREVDYLNGMCLVTFFKENKEAVRAVVLFRFQAFCGDPAFAKPNSFHLFCTELSMEMRDTFSQAIHRSGEPPKALTRAIFDHLEARGKVEYPLQADFRRAKPIYDVFAHFIAVKTLAGRLSRSKKELDDARATRAGIESGTVVLKKVKEIPNPSNPYSSGC